MDKERRTAEIDWQPRFEKTVEEARSRGHLSTDSRWVPYCLMSNHFHAVNKTPNAKSWSKGHRLQVYSPNGTSASSELINAIAAHAVAEAEIH